MNPVYDFSRRVAQVVGTSTGIHAAPAHDFALSGEKSRARRCGFQAR